MATVLKDEIRYMVPSSFKFKRTGTIDPYVHFLLKIRISTREIKYLSNINV